VREKQESKRNCLEDLAKLNDAYNTTRAAKELAEKELAKVKRQVEEARGDWMKKIRERRAEVSNTGQRAAKSLLRRLHDHHAGEISFAGCFRMFKQVI
jgi:hypothetical protein